MPCGAFLEDILKYTYYMAKATEYVKDTMAEMKHVSWPTREQSINYTLLVIAISILVAVLIYVCDQLFIFLLRTFIFK